MATVKNDRIKSKETNQVKFRAERAKELHWKGKKVSAMDDNLYTYTKENNLLKLAKVCWEKRDGFNFAEQAHSYLKKYVEEYLFDLGVGQLFSLASTCQYMEAYKECEACLRRVIEVTGDNPDAEECVQAHYELSELYGKQKRYKEALFEISLCCAFEDVQSKRAEDYSYLSENEYEYCRSRYYMALGEVEKAIECMNNRLDDDTRGNYGQLYASRAEYYMASEKYKDAVDDFVMAIKRCNPEEPKDNDNSDLKEWALYETRCANAYYQLGDYPKAISYCNNLINYGKAREFAQMELMYAYTVRADANMKLKNYAEGLLDYYRALLLDPDRSGFELNRPVFKLSFDNVSYLHIFGSSDHLDKDATASLVSRYPVLSSDYDYNALLEALQITDAQDSPLDYYRSLQKICNKLVDMLSVYKSAIEGIKDKIKNPTADEAELLARFERIKTGAEVDFDFLSKMLTNLKEKATGKEMAFLQAMKSEDMLVEVAHYYQEKLVPLSVITKYLVEQIQNELKLVEPNL